MIAKETMCFLFKSHQFSHSRKSVGANLSYLHHVSCEKVSCSRYVPHGGLET